MYLFEDTRDVMLQTLKEDAHRQVRAQSQQGLLKCKCGFNPKMKLSRTTKNYNKVFLSCGSFLQDKNPVALFNGPLWRPREQVQPSLRRWVKETLVPLLKKHYLNTGREQTDGPIPRPMLYETRDNTGWTSMCKTPIMPDQQWLNQFAEVTEAQERERERMRSGNHFQSKFGSVTLF